LFNLKRIPLNLILATTSVVASIGLATTARAASYYWFGPTVPSPYTQAGANQWCGQQWNSLPWQVSTNQNYQIIDQWKLGDGGVQLRNFQYAYADMQKRRCVAVTN
jgi:hypothetical protein